MESRRMLAAVAAIAALSVLIGPWTTRSAVGELKASAPRPADGAVGVTTPLLTWIGGETALWHNVYFGTRADLTEADLVSARQPFCLYYHIHGFEPGVTYYWRVDEIEADEVTIHTGDVWSFTTLPWTATNPSPHDDAESVAPNTRLTWTPGADAVEHEVYFGTNEAAVANGTAGAFKGTQVPPTYDPGALTLGTTYYWRIDELEPDGTTHRGAVWSFTTAGELETPIYYVDGENGSDDNNGLRPETALATIQEAIASAVDGDTVLVYPGIYRDPVDFLGKAITVRSAERAAVLEVEDDFAVSFHRKEGLASILENFVIRNSFMGIFIAQSSPTIRNVTIVGNKHGLEAYAHSQPDISNCIFWYNTGDDLFGCQVRYSCIERGADGTGNFSSDPLFADPNAGDYHLLSERGRYWPEHDVWVLDKVGSPCLDAGDPQSDYSGEPIPNGGRINMGAYGGTAYASLSEGRRVPNEPPHVIITSPADGASYSPSQTIEIKAEAWDVDGAVVNVEFFADGEKIGEDADGSDGWAVEWTMALLEPHEIVVARATDNDGATTDSAPVTIHRRIPRHR